MASPFNQHGSLYIVSASLSNVAASLTPGVLILSCKNCMTVTLSHSPVRILALQLGVINTFIIFQYFSILSLRHYYLSGLLHLQHNSQLKVLFVLFEYKLINVSYIQVISAIYISIGIFILKITTINGLMRVTGWLDRVSGI